MLSVLFVCRYLLTERNNVKGGPGAACGVPGAVMESSHPPLQRLRRSPAGGGKRERARPSSLALHPSAARHTPSSSSSSGGDPCHASSLEPRPRDPDAIPDHHHTSELSVVHETDTTSEARTPVADSTPEPPTPEPHTPDADARPESRTPESSATLVPLTPDLDATSESRTPDSHTPKSRRATPEARSDSLSVKSRPRRAVSSARSVRRKGSQARQGRARRALYVAAPLPPPPREPNVVKTLPPPPENSVVTTLPPPREPNVVRAQTEPPPSSSPDILQVSWVWETARHTSLRRRPSRRVSCRWKRPRVMPRRAPLRCMKLGGLGDDSVEDNGGDGEGDDTVVIWQVPRQEVEVAGRSTSGRHQGGNTAETGGVRRRAKSESAVRSLKRKWRHSDLFPRLLSEAVHQVKPDQSGDKRTLMEKAKHLPGYMKKVSHVLFRTSKDDEEGNCVVRRTGASTFYVEVGNCSQDLTGAVLGETAGGDASRSSRRHSPSMRGGFLRPRTLNWNQKYQRAMEQRSSRGPNISVTSPEGACSPGDGDAKNEDGKGLLGRIFGQLRPRSGSTSTSRSYVSSRSSMSGGSEDGQSPSHSSDYEEQDEAERTGSASLVGRMRGLRRDMQKKISRLKSPRGSTSSSPGPLGPLDRPPATATLSAPGSASHPAATSCESLPSSAPPAAAPPGSNRSSLSGEDTEPYTGPFIGRARALVDCQPSPYDRDALKFKKGDTIDIIAKNPSGLWKGCVDGRVGHFKFILVEEEVERPVRKSRGGRGTTPRRGRSRTLEELLTRLHLSHLIQVFMLNGYEDLEHFRDLEKADLDCLGITDPETCAKLLTAVALLHDADSDPEPDLPETLETTEAALRRGDHGRDSGCYTDHRCSTQPPSVIDENNLDTRQSTPSTDTSSGYHSRGPYNIPVGEGGQAMRDDAHGSALDSPPSEATTSGTATLPSSTSESHSYRAHPATVLPASPHTQARHAHHQGDHRFKHDPDVDYEAKFVTARSVFEKEVVRREVPVSVRGQKHGTNPQQAAGEVEQAGSSETGGGATESPP